MNMTVAQAKDRAQVAARGLLSKMWVNRRFPVDPARIANDLGLDVILMKLPDDISGALLKEKQQDPAIVLNQSDSQNRQRFTCAHELGHYILRLEDGMTADEYEFLDLRDSVASNGDEPDEVFANQFAANLLMPKEELCTLVSEKTPWTLIAWHFKVSDDALRIRMKSLGLP